MKSQKAIVSIVQAVILAFAFVEAHAQEAVGILQKPIGSFDVDGISRINAVLMLANRQQIPLGIEYAGSELFVPVTLHVGSTDTSTVMDALFPAGNGFRVSDRNGVVIINHTEVPTGASNVLNTTLPEFSIPQCSVQMANTLLRVRLSQQLRSDGRSGYGLSISGAGSLQIGPFALSHVTIREVLDRIVREDGRAAWIVQVKPEILSQHLDQESAQKIIDGDLILWTVVEYDSPLLEKIGQITQERALH